MKLRTCVTPEGRFSYGIHKPSYAVKNMRENDLLQTLGLDAADRPVANAQNFPSGDIEEPAGAWIYEIPNPFPFRGATYIDRKWADAKAADPLATTLPPPAPTSMTSFLRKNIHPGRRSELESVNEAFAELPAAVLLALAATSTDPKDLVRLAEMACDLVYDDKSSLPVGLRYDRDVAGRPAVRIHHHDLFETLANNCYLPDVYKEVMVLRPGVQGSSEIVGEWPPERDSHVFEYLRRNSYIPWGHFAANMADDLVRYKVDDLSDHDFEGLRHLYYQRTFIRLAEQLGLSVTKRRKCLNPGELERLRLEIIAVLEGDDSPPLQFDATLWGWNYGFDFAASGFRLHASHQQIHNQFAMLPREVAEAEEDERKISSYSCGDLVEDWVRIYEEEHGSSFFNDYVRCIRNNSRTDGRRDLAADLVVFEDDRVLLFVPKAQTSQWELQLLTKDATGNILETDATGRRSLDRGILAAMRVLTGMGARLVTVVEFSKRIGISDIDQRLLYSFLPKLPYSMGAFSEAESRFINGHYPEDFAVVCRLQLEGE